MDIIINHDIIVNDGTIGPKFRKKGERFAVTKKTAALLVAQGQARVLTSSDKKSV